MRVPRLGKVFRTSPESRRFATATPIRGVGDCVWLSLSVDRTRGPATPLPQCSFGRGVNHRGPTIGAGSQTLAPAPRIIPRGRAKITAMQIHATGPSFEKGAVSSGMRPPPVHARSTRAYGSDSAAYPARVCASTLATMVSVLVPVYRGPGVISVVFTAYLQDLRRASRRVNS